MNPNTVAQNRTARLVSEARTPTYSTATPTAPVERDHLEMVQVDTGTGTYWSGPFKSSQMKGVLAQYDEYGYGISDIDCSGKCWCAK